MDITLKNVRLAFPNLFVAVHVMDSKVATFEATFLIPKDSDQFALVNEAMEVEAKKQWKNKYRDTLDKLIAAERVCFRDGDSKDLDGYKDHFYLASRNLKRPTVVDRDRSLLNQEDGRPYSGCYVNARVNIWAQDNKYGKRINATLLGVQFNRDGDAFSGGRVASPEEFDTLDIQDDII